MIRKKFILFVNMFLLMLISLFSFSLNTKASSHSDVYYFTLRLNAENNNDAYYRTEFEEHIYYDELICDMAYDLSLNYASEFVEYNAFLDGRYSMENYILYDTYVIVNIPTRMLPNTSSMEFLDGLCSWFSLLKNNGCTIMFIDGTYESLYCTYSEFLDYVDFHIDTDVFVLLLENYMDITYNYISSNIGYLNHFNYYFDYNTTSIIFQEHLLEYVLLPIFVRQMGFHNPFLINPFLMNFHSDIVFTFDENSYLDYSLAANCRNFIINCDNDATTMNMLWNSDIYYEWMNFVMATNCRISLTYGVNDDVYDEFYYNYGFEPLMDYNINGEVIENNYYNRSKMPSIDEMIFTFLSVDEIAIYDNWEGRASITHIMLSETLGLQSFIYESNGDGDGIFPSLFNTSGFDIHRFEDYFEFLEDTRS